MSSPPGEPGPQMDADVDVDVEDEVICSPLPQDIQARIQARLPLVSLMQSRAVCKAWNAAASSPGLWQERLEFREGAREFVLFVVGLSLIRIPGAGHESRIASCVYDPESRRWYKLDLPPWLRHLGRGSGKEMVEISGGSRSAGGGALLSTTFMWGERKMVIPHLGNPVAGSWTRHMPALPEGLQSRHVLGVFVGDKGRSFKMVALYWENKRKRTFVFDSALELYFWKETTRAWPATSEGFNDSACDVQGVFVGTVLYCVAGECMDGKCNLLAYDLKRASWSWMAVSTPSPLFEIFFCSLINVRDRLLCVVVGSEEVGEEALEMCLQIWEMDFERVTWKVVDAMPAPMFDGFELGFKRSRLVPDGGFLRYRIMVVSGRDSQVYISHGELDKMVAVDLGKTSGAWRWLPSWPYELFVCKSLHCVDPWLQFGG